MTVRPPGATAGLSFQTESAFAAPTWPPGQTSGLFRQDELAADRIAREPAACSPST